MKKKLICFFLVFAGWGGVAHGTDSDWLKNWKFKGDFRVRYEGTDFDDEGTKTRNRGRYRLRLNADITISKNLSTHVRLASGEGAATSTNQSFDESFGGKDLFVDRAFLVYRTGGWKLGAGKMANPLTTTDIVWDSDVNPEGFYQSYSAERFYATLGEMMVEEESSAADTNLIVFQLGTKDPKGKWNVAAAYYNYLGHEIGGIDLDYQFIDALAALKFQLGALPGSARFHVVKNVTSEITDEDTAWGVFADLGRDKNPGDWKFSLKYARIEGFSSLELFTDSDFGFADKRGFSAAASFVSGSRLSWKVTTFFVDSIVAEDKGFNRIQVDGSLKF